MVKKLKILIKSKWIRRSFLLLACALVLFASVSPAFAYGVVFEADSNLVPLITGNLTLRMYADGVTPSANAGKHDVSIGLPSLYEYTPENGKYYDMAEYIEFYNRNVGSESARWQDYQFDIMGGRWKQIISDHTYWKFRTSLDAWSVLTPENNAYFDNAIFNLEPFAAPLNETLFKNLFALRLDIRCNYRVSATFHYVNDNGHLVTADYSQALLDVTPLRWCFAFWDELGVRSFDNWCSYNGLTVGQPVLVTDFVVKVDAKPTGYGSLHELSWQNLTHTFFDASNPRPVYWEAHQGPNWFLRQIKDDLIWGDPNPPSLPEVDTGIGAQFTEFLAGSVSGFFDVEIMPGFSLGGIMACIISVVIVLLLLKFFAGG